MRKFKKIDIIDYAINLSILDFKYISFAYGMSKGKYYKSIHIGF